MADYTQTIIDYEAQLNALAASIQANVELLAVNHLVQLGKNAQIETAENSIMLDVMQQRFDVEGHPQYNKLKYTNAEQRKAAGQLAEDADTDFQDLIADRNLLYAQGKELEALIEFERRQFKAAHTAMSFYATNPT